MGAGKWSTPGAVAGAIHLPGVIAGLPARSLNRRSRRSASAVAALSGRRGRSRSRASATASCRRFDGEAYGVVVVAGDARGTLPGLSGISAGSVGVAGRSAARLEVKAAALGDRGQAGTGVAVLKGLTVAGAGVAGARGAGSGVIVLELKGAATGRHDDDEAAVLAFLLAA